MRSLITISSLTLVVLAAEVVAAASTRGPADRTWTECYNDGTCADVSEWEYTKKYDGSVDSSNSGNSYSNSETNINTSSNTSTNTNTNSGNSNYNYYYYGQPSNGYWLNGVWYNADGSVGTSNAPAANSKSADNGNNGNNGNSGNYNSDNKKLHKGRHLSNSKLGNYYRYRAQVADTRAEYKNRLHNGRYNYLYY